MTTRRSIASLATTATAALALTSAASAFPDKLLQFVTPYPFGGSHALHASIITTAAEPVPLTAIPLTLAAIYLALFVLHARESRGGFSSLRSSRMFAIERPFAARPISGIS